MIIKGKGLEWNFVHVNPENIIPKIAIKVMEEHKDECLKLIANIKHQYK